MNQDDLWSSLYGTGGSQVWEQGERKVGGITTSPTLPFPCTILVCGGVDGTSLIPKLSTCKLKTARQWSGNKAIKTARQWSWNEAIKTARQWSGNEATYM